MYTGRSSGVFLGIVHDCVEMGAWHIACAAISAASKH